MMMTYHSNRNHETIRVITEATFLEGSLVGPGEYGLGMTNVKTETQFKNMRVAFTGTSGAGKTTMVKYVEERFGLTHISGSAGDVTSPLDKLLLQRLFSYEGDGHRDVIAYSSENPKYGIINQALLQMRRSQIIMENDNFVTDRSPVDNMTYFISQCGFHKLVTDEICGAFFNECVRAFSGLTHVIYIPPVQPDLVENNGSRVDNKWYQEAVDAQFSLWLNKMREALGVNSRPKLLTLTKWDLEWRKEEIYKFLNVK